MHLKVHLKIASRTVENVASHLMTKFITRDIFAVKSVLHITNSIVIIMFYSAHVVVYIGFEFTLFGGKIVKKYI